MRLKVVGRAFGLNGRIALRPRKRERHGLLEQLEALYFFYGVGGRLGVVEDDKRLTLGLEVALRDDVEDRSIFTEYFFQRLLELVDLYTLLEIFDVDPA